MFLISMRFGQGIGNQLWLLSTGLYLSKKYNRKLVVKNMKWFLGRNIVSKELFSHVTRWSSDFYKYKWFTFNDNFFQEENSNRSFFLPLIENRRLSIKGSEIITFINIPYFTIKTRIIKKLSL